MAFKKYTLYPRVVDDLKKRSFIGIFFYLVVLYLVLFTGDYYDRHPEFSNWLAFSVCSICMFRFFHRLVAKWLEPRFVKSNNWVFFFSVPITALIWGVGFAVFMLQDGEANANLLMVMCTIGLSSGAAVAFIPDFRISFLFSTFMLVPAIAVMLFFSINLPLAVAIILMFMYLCFMAYRGNREYWNALENEYLLEKKSWALEKISRIDSLTELYNRRHFDDMYAFEWDRAARKKQSISIIIADIDHFKKVNDEYGHPAGDEYLKAVGHSFKQVFKRKIDIVARYGGEEFIVLMPGESEEIVFEIAQDIRLRFEKYRLEYNGHSLKATLSLGVASCIPNQGQKSQSLISKADKALYKSKIDGRNRVTVSA